MFKKLFLIFLMLFSINIFADDHEGADEMDTDTETEIETAEDEE
ncbi:MAG: hypothetical protein O2915_04270 [Proteobacteria bacterium]|jgi:hypothetical protein|nr:hypothetical protein [Pseudomonadota bacterium]MDA0872970.1 hypothetical protein [Pseudomonadota bacterium]